jgi:hypothetical protein
VDASSAVRITLADSAGAVQAECFFGKGGSTSFSQYVRLPSADDVIQINSRIEKTVRLKEWVERRLFGDFYGADAVQVTVETSLVFSDDAKPLRRHIGYTLVQGEKGENDQETWKVLEDDRLPLSTSPVNGFISSISRFTADNVVKEPESLGLDPQKPLGSVVVALKSGTSYTLFLLGEAESEEDVFYVTNQEHDYIYTAGKWALKDIFRQGIDSFIDTQALLNPKEKK